MSTVPNIHPLAAAALAGLAPPGSDVHRVLNAPMDALIDSSRPLGTMPRYEDCPHCGGSGRREVIEPKQGLRS